MVDLDFDRLRALEVCLNPARVQHVVRRNKRVQQIRDEPKEYATVFARITLDFGSLQNFFDRP
jgi:hypothetical protein